MGTYFPMRHCSLGEDTNMRASYLPVPLTQQEVVRLHQGMSQIATRMDAEELEHLADLLHEISQAKKHHRTFQYFEGYA
jgi:hypothetical protein